MLPAAGVVLYIEGVNANTVVVLCLFGPLLYIFGIIFEYLSYSDYFKLSNRFKMESCGLLMSDIAWWYILLFPLAAVIWAASNHQ